MIFSETKLVKSMFRFPDFITNVRIRIMFNCEKINDLLPQVHLSQRGRINHNKQDKF